MEQYRRAKQHSRKEVYCNCCNQPIIKDELSSHPVDYLHIEKAWGYFSSKDLVGHSFNICEQCYDKWIASFCIPVEEFPVDEIPMYSDDEIDEINAAYEAEFNKSNL